ncbi:MAG: substrate-binding domain-containing protein [Lachnospiraceae bacterium]|nr:substrate-binding domain-containing protein [Lachnospiraceae bacterium]
MKKKLLSVVLAAAMVASVLAGCGSSAAETAAPAAADTQEAAADTAAADTAAADTAAADAGASSGGMTCALVTKSAGNAFMELLGSGFKDAVEASGGTAIIKDPASATADAQISEISSLISQGVDSILVAANDENALKAVLKEATDAGIKVLTVDSDVSADSRAVFINQASTELIGQTLLDAVYDIAGGEGQYAILSATSQATNQNAWIEAMKNAAAADSKYSKLELVEVAYGDDEPQKSTDQTQALLEKYPDLKVICAPTTVGIAAGAKVLQDSKSKVKMTGLGLPSEMQEYMGDDDAHSCPYMFLWNMIDLGNLAGYTSVALVNGDLTGKAGDKYTAGSMGDFEVVDVNGATQVILGNPFKFTPENVKEWADKGM